MEATILISLGGIVGLALAIYMMICWRDAVEAEQEARMRAVEARLHPHRLDGPPKGVTASAGFATGTGHVIMRHAHGTTRHRIQRRSGGGYCIDDVDMDIGLDLADLVTMGIIAMQDALEYQATCADQMSSGASVEGYRFDFPTVDTETQSPVPEQFFHVTPVETPSSGPDWGDSRRSAPEPDHGVYSYEPPSHYEAPSHSHSDWGDSSSSSSSSYDSGSSSSSDSGGGGGGD